ncbi:D-alanine--D-alanine ligase family protein [Treponema pectinovorum]|uniref:D-alanine--D-alanine ligase family protein n=1 Tax=Treponema pectinovorum TaxID=164 RepID=UPI0011CCA642|nr:D-alanine--D-alanine ligase family protein [Treponema pectinovorum]
MDITLIYGGKSGEHEISLVSAAAVARNIKKEHNITLIAITKTGRWFLQEKSELERIQNDSNASFKISEDEKNEVFIVPGGGTKRALFANSKHIPTDVVFPVLHGTFGEDGTIQGLLEMAELPYVGCPTLASAITMDKEKSKSALAQLGIPVVPGLCMRKSDIADWKRYDEILDEAQKKLGFPMFVKPCSAGSSDGANLAKNLQQLNGAIMEAFCWDNKILIEKAIDAREIECSVTGNPTTFDGKNDFEKLTAYGPGEISPTHQFYDYDAKYKDPNGAELLIPANLPEERLEEVRTLAKKAFKALDLAGLSRVDFFIDRKTDMLYLNEINTMPGFTQISMFPKMCEKFGLDFPNLTELLLKQAVERFKSARKLKTSR